MNDIPVTICAHTLFHPGRWWNFLDLWSPGLLISYIPHCLTLQSPKGRKMDIVTQLLRSPNIDRRRKICLASMIF